MKKVGIGIDIGGTNTQIGFVDKEGNVLLSTKMSTSIGETFEDYLDELYNTIEKAKKESNEDFDILGIGIGAPNANYYKGTIEFAANLRWKGVIEVTKLVTEKFGLPSVMTNDANAAAIGEMVFGGAKGMDDFIMITLGTGVGSGIVTGGKLVYGSDGFAGELGHVRVEKNGRLCGCGKRGCLETYTSATGIKRTAFEVMADRNEKTSLSSLSYDELTAFHIYEAANNGDHLAREIFRKTGTILGEALADFVAAGSPQAIFLFGGLSKAGDLILKPTEQAMEENLLHIFKNKVKVQFSHLDGDSAAVVGASALAWNEFDK
ncbi:MAG: ROK family protein [Ichthyobacteriaceae bacterium]|nr:ROK family protein [Ichthyobacteriaceae bacterium]